VIIQALKITSLQAGIHVMEPGPVEVPLRDAFENSFCSFRCIPDEEGGIRIHLTPSARMRFSNSTSVLKLASFTIRPGRPGSPVRKVQGGLLTYDNKVNLVRFLSQNEVSGKFPLSDAIGKLKKEKKRGLALALQALLKENEEDNVLIQNESVYPKIPALSEEGFENTFKYVSGGAVKTSIKGSDYGIRTNRVQRFYLDDYFQLSPQKRVPSRKWLDVSEAGGFFWDGERLDTFLLGERRESREWEKVRKNVPHLFLEKLEKQGSVEEQTPEIFLPLGNCEVSCLVRIPSYPEVKKKLLDSKYNEAILKMGAPRGAREILLLRDIRNACVALRKNLKVIDRTDEVLYLLSRTKKDIYIPEDNGVMTKNIFEGREYYLAGFKVKL